MPVYRYMSTEAIRAYLLERIDLGPNGCWIWQGAVDRGGYPLCQVNGRQYRATRLSYMVFRGPIPENFDVHHECGCRACINPSHLQAKPHLAHMRKHSHSGVWRGEKNGRAKLTEVDVQFIRVAGEFVSAKSLAAQFEVSERTIFYVKSGRTWAHVELPEIPKLSLSEVREQVRVVANRFLGVLIDFQEHRRERGEPEFPITGEDAYSVMRACTGL